MATYQSRQRDPLVDPNTQVMLERRGKEMIGIGLILLAILFAAILGTYSPQDPGWMVATDEPAHNMLGRFGAAIASTLMIVTGKGTWGLPIVLFAWGIRFVLHRGAERAAGRVVFAVIAVALASVFAATHVPGADWPHSFGLGGLFGDTVLGAVLVATPVQATFGLKVISLIVGVALLAMGLFVTGFDKEELRSVARFLFIGSILTYSQMMHWAGRGAAGAAGSARALQARQQARKSDAMAARAAQNDWQMQDEPLMDRRQMPADPTMAPQPLRGRVRHADPVFEDDSAPIYAPPAFSGQKPLRADPRQAEPAAQMVAPLHAPKEKLGFLARMRRAAAPDHAQDLTAEEAAYMATLHPEDRIKARISDVIRSRTRSGAPIGLPTANMSAITAAIARREPVMRGARVMPPVISTAAQMVPSMDLPAEPPLVAQPRMAAVTPPLSATRATRVQPAAQPAPRMAVQPPAPQQWAEDLVDDLDDGDDLAYGDHQERYDAHGYAEEPSFTAAQSLAAEDDWSQDDDFEPDYDAVPVSAAARIPMPDPKRVVQHSAKKPIAPSSRAVAESEPRMRFDDPAPVYELPPLSLLTSPSTVQRHSLSDDALEENARMLESVLDDYGVKGEIVSVRPGPVVTMYELEPAPGLKASRVIGLADDIARSMSALSARVSTVPGRTVIGIELPNVTREKVVLREIIAARDFGDSAMRLPLALGKDIGGDPIVANLAKMPHLLIAGTTGSGKSVAINTMILSLLYKLSPEECRLIMIDPKMLELSVYDGIPHLLSPVVTDPKKAVVALKWVVGEMEERYRKMSKMGVRNIEGYNGRVREALAKGEMFKRTIQTGFDDNTGEPVFETDEFQPVSLPYIVVVVDEMADLMMVAGKEIEACIQRLAQMARASGIHLIMATQRPSVDVITGTIKANFPTRISFQVTSKIDSRTILGEQGAEQLLGMGDMLYMAGGGKVSRIHGPFVSDEEVEEIVNHLKSYGPPVYMSGVVEGVDDDKADDIDMVLGLGGGDGTEDALYDQAVAVVAKDRKCSTSYIQRKLGIGYNKAARLVEQMEENHVVTTANHVGKREILLPEH